jgi:hypothetical protein
MHLQVCGGEKKEKTHARTRSPRQGVAWRGVARRWARAHDVRMNSPLKSGSKPRRPATSFYRLFLTSPCLIRFDRDRHSRLRDTVTLVRSSLYICTVATEIVTKKMNSHKSTNTSRFHRFCCCAAEATSSHSSTCICNRESRSSEPSCSTILHRGRTNKVFGKRSSRLLARFIKFSTTARLPLLRSRAEGRRLQRELHQTNHRLHPVIIVKEP